MKLEFSAIKNELCHEKTSLCWIIYQEYAYYDDEGNLWHLKIEKTLEVIKLSHGCFYDLAKNWWLYENFDQSCCLIKLLLSIND